MTTLGSPALSPKEIFGSGHMTNPLFPKPTALFGQNGWILAIVFSVRELVVFCTMTSSWSIKHKKTTWQNNIQPC